MNLGNVLLEDTGLCIDYNTLFEDTSFELEVLDDMISQSTQLREDTEAMYSNILNDIPINESLSEIYDSFKNTISKMVEYLKKLFKKFWDKMLQYLDDNKYINSNIDVLHNMGSFVFKTEGYKYSFYDNKIVSVFDSIATKVHNIASKCNVNSTTDDIINALNKFYDDSIISNTEEYYNYIRSILINSDRLSVTRDEFNDLARRSFRSGYGAPDSKMLIDKKYIDTNVISDLLVKKSYSKMKDQGVSDLVKCDKILRDIGNSIDIIIRRYNRLYNVNSDKSANCAISLHAFYVKISNIINNIYNITRLYMSIRFDAIKEMTIQNKRIAKEAIIHLNHFH